MSKVYIVHTKLNMRNIKGGENIQVSSGKTKEEDGFRRYKMHEK